VIAIDAQSWCNFPSKLHMRGQGRCMTGAEVH
jgi:hypothetical protein